MAKGKRYDRQQQTGKARADKSQEEDVIPPLLDFKREYGHGLTAELLYGDLIYAVKNFLSMNECARVRKYADQEGFERVTQRASRDYAFRDNDRILRRLPAVAELLWERIKPLVPEEYEGMRAVGLNPALRFYRYRAGQSFGCHVDQSDVDPVTGYHSRFTVLVYLNDAEDSDLKGGSTVFYGEPTSRKAKQKPVVLDVAPKTGAALIHGHGDQCLLHEGAAVSQGAKYLLRTDVMYTNTSG